MNKVFSKETKNRMSKSHLGKKLSNETKEKIGKGNKGKIYSKETREKISKSRLGMIPWNKGIPHSKETKDKISKSNRGKYGSNNTNWKGGITSLSILIKNLYESRQWRDDVFTRDKFTCQKCGDNRGGNLNAHHIKAVKEILQYNEIMNIKEALECEELFNINNGIILCEKCHRIEHKRSKK